MRTVGKHEEHRSRLTPRRSEVESPVITGNAQQKHPSQTPTVSTGIKGPITRVPAVIRASDCKLTYSGNGPAPVVAAVA